MRRNLLLVRRFSAKFPGGSFLLIAEAREAGIFDFPDNVDCISLPAVRKDASGNCSPRRLQIDLSELIRLRRDVISAALSSFAPDVLIVDHLPKGALGELTHALELLRAKRGTRFVLGFRDILEEPETVRAEWSRGGCQQAIEQFFDAIWIYGDPAVYDMLAEYDLPPTISERARYTGYLNPADACGTEGAGDADTLAARLLGNSRFVFCEVGGGQDGQRIAQAFVDAEMPHDTIGVLLTGPFMPAHDREALSRRANKRSSEIHVLDLISEPTELLARAHRVITMGGYNSVCEVLAHRKHALIVPRTTPRREQLIRAQRMANLGLVEYVHPAELTPHAISDWLHRPPASRSQHHRIDMNGLDRAGWYLEEVIRDRWPGAVASADYTAGIEASA